MVRSQWAEPVGHAAWSPGVGGLWGEDRGGGGRVRVLNFDGWSDQEFV